MKAAAAEATDEETSEAAECGGETGNKPKPKRKRGRRNLEESDLPVERIELTDPAREGTDERISFEESSRLG
jgi:hypothetical protein